MYPRVQLDPRVRKSARLCYKCDYIVPHISIKQAKGSVPGSLRRASVGKSRSLLARSAALKKTAAARVTSADLLARRQSHALSARRKDSKEKAEEKEEEGNSSESDSSESPGESDVSEKAGVEVDSAQQASARSERALTLSPPLGLCSSRSPGLSIFFYSAIAEENESRATQLKFNNELLCALSIAPASVSFLRGDLAPALSAKEALAKKPTKGGLLMHCCLKERQHPESLIFVKASCQCQK